MNPGTNGLEKKKLKTKNTAWKVREKQNKVVHNFIYVSQKMLYYIIWFSIVNLERERESCWVNG